MSMLGESGGGHAPTALLEPTSPGATSAPEPEIPEIVIRPRPGWIAIDWRELFAARELLFFLVWRDVKIRYKQTVLGATWAVLQPLFTMIIFSVITERCRNNSSFRRPTRPPRRRTA